LVDALVSGTSGESRGGSSPLLGTILFRIVLSASIEGWPDGRVLLDPESGACGPQRAVAAMLARFHTIGRGLRKKRLFRCVESPASVPTGRSGAGGAPLAFRMNILPPQCEDRGAAVLMSSGVERASRGRDAAPWPIGAVTEDRTQEKVRSLFGVPAGKAASRA
jgi:hypothetical protein